jgi:tetratricopeptide (TPR) repeat protein
MFNTLNADRARSLSRPPHQTPAPADRGAEEAPARPSQPFALKQNWPYWLVPVALALIASANTLKNGFAFDDEAQVLKNRFIQSFANLPLEFTTSVWSFLGDSLNPGTIPYYRPMFMVLFTASYGLFGTQAWGWHLVNVLIHAAATFLVFMVFKEATNRKGAAAIAAALFAVHPVHAESVAWISGITDPWLAVFLLPAFYYYLRYRATGRRRLMAVALGFYFVALLCKETAIMLPLLIAYCELVHFKDSRTFRQKAIDAAIKGALFVAPTAIYLLMRYHAIESWFLTSRTRFTQGEALSTAPLIATKYIALLIAPFGYNLHHYTLPVQSLTSIAFIGPAALLAVIAALILRSKSRTLMFAAVWFVLWIIPPVAATRVFEPQYSVQERYLYLPSMGFCLAVSLGFEWLAARRFGRVPATIVLIATVIALGALGVYQNRVWNNTISLFQHLVTTDPSSPLARVELAGTFYVAGRRQEGEAEARTALDLDPDNVDAHITLAMIAFNQGRVDQSINLMERAKTLVGEWRLKAGYLSRICSDLAFYYDERKDYDRAEENFRQAVEVLPFWKTWGALGQFYYDRGRYEEALELLERSSHEVSNRYSTIHLQLARTYDRLHDNEHAVTEYERYLQLAEPGAQERTEAMRRLTRLRSGN